MNLSNRRRFIRRLLPTHKTNWQFCSLVRSRSLLIPIPEYAAASSTIGRKPRCEVGVFFFGQPGFHNAAAVGRVVFLSHGRDLLSCLMSAAGISGASRKAGFGEGTPQQVSREGQNRRIADFGTVVETCSVTSADCPCLVFSYIERTGQGLRPAVGGLFSFHQRYF